MRVTRPRLKGFRSDGPVLVLVVAAAAGIVLPHLFLHTGLINVGTGMNARLFGPSVMVAAGREYSLPDAAQVPALNRFLRQEDTTLDPASLPDDIPLRRLRDWDKCHRYLLTLVGVVWRLFGISWTTYKIPMALLYCVTAAVAYGVFRLGMNRFLSAVGTLLFISSPQVLLTLLHLRDYSKAPFILLVLLILGYLLKKPVRPRRFVALAAVLGFVLGLGWGFRQDLVICVPVSVAVLALGVRGNPRLSMGRRAAAIALLFACFYVPARPIIRTIRDEAGATATHDIMMGFATDCVDNLSLGRASYQVFYAFDDNLMHAVRSSYSQRILGDPVAIPFESPESAKVGHDVLAEIVKTFPADLAARGLAAVGYVLKDPRIRMSSREKAPNKVVALTQKIHRPIGNHIRRFGLFYAGTFVLFTMFRNLRLAWILFFLILYFCGYTSIQFQLRHAFHLGFLALWFVGFWMDRLWWAGGRLRHSEVRATVKTFLHSPRRWWSRRATWVVVSCAAAAAMIAFPFHALRAYQDATVSNLQETYRQADLEPIQTRQVSWPNGWILFEPVLPWDALTEGVDVRAAAWTAVMALSGRFSGTPLGPLIAGVALRESIDRFVRSEEAVRFQYLAVDFAPGTSEHLVGITYDQSHNPVGFDKVLAVQTPGGAGGSATRYFFPVYEFDLPVYDILGPSRFLGIRVPKEQAQDLRAVYRVRNVNDFPLLLNLTLPPEDGLFRRHVTMWGGGRKWHQPSRRRVEIQVAKGDQRAAAGDFEGALKAYRSAIQIEPLGSPLAHDRLDCLYVTKGDTPGRVAEWEAMTRTYPENARAHFHFGMALQAAGRIPEARVAAEYATALVPNDPAFLGFLGELCVQQERFSDAVPVLRRALEYGGDPGHVRLELIRALCAMGNYDEAREELLRFEEGGETPPEDVVEALMRAPSE
ncbi:MAG TPA: tetratricopeptide repeat protein [Candidatus Hydrogenedentes bacterium]|nr:tetratricopeptide repeat protein [Candidatus Hydrogenedentota bacterium]